MNPSQTSPKSSTKKLGMSVVVAGAGVALLAGGATTFALWYDSVELPGAEISSGQLKLERGDGDWFNKSGELETLVGYHVIPGETLTYTETVTLHATGDLLQADLTTSFDAAGVFTGGDAGLAAKLREASKFFVDDQEMAGLTVPITESDDERELEVRLDVTFPSDVKDEELQNVATNLASIHTIVTQTAVEVQDTEDTQDAAEAQA